MTLQNLTSATSLFDASGLNVHSDISDFGRTKSLSFRLFAGAHRILFGPKAGPDAKGIHRATMRLAKMRGSYKIHAKTGTGQKLRKAARKLRAMRAT